MRRHATVVARPDPPALRSAREPRSQPYVAGRKPRSRKGVLAMTTSQPVGASSTAAPAPAPTPPLPTAPTFVGFGTLNGFADAVDPARPVLALPLVEPGSSTSTKRPSAIVAARRNLQSDLWRRHKARVCARPRLHFFPPARTLAEPVRVFCCPRAFGPNLPVRRCPQARPRRSLPLPLRAVTLCPARTRSRSEPHRLALVCPTSPAPLDNQPHK